MTTANPRSGEGDGLEGLADLILPKNKPSVFFAFKHGPALLNITYQMQRELASRDIMAIRLIDHSLPGTNLRERARALIRSTDGTVLFWSSEATQSQWVKDEYDTARRFNRAVCLVLFPGVSPPTDWNPDVEWVNLEGFVAPKVSLPPNSTTVAGLVSNASLFKGMIGKIIAFANYNHQLRQFRIMSLVSGRPPGGGEREVELAVTVAGGTAPYTYVYLGLPPGIVTANAPRIGGFSKSAGVFNVTVLVRDAVGREIAMATKVVVK